MVFGNYTPLFHIPEENHDKDPINVHCGGEILHHFQEQWENIHQLNEENAKKANMLADDIQKLASKIDSSKKNIILITNMISKLSSDISDGLECVKRLYSTTETIESKLIDLENLIDEVEFKKLKEQHCFHLEQYEKKKKDAFETTKCALQENHQKKVADYEASKKLLMEERQKVFQDAFKLDLELYKTSGTMPDHKQISPNGALLEEIQLDVDQNELSKFFDDTNEST
ncbi:unnamed protein product [Callosobruchus maculatus]|uniref:Dysbindin n=1 Tax=Callosobruchus maculatus TaxID=64391 RepID=A0A653DBW3_CALMS|nr:unnamed protein product [Callosobruchus maculatus]